MPYPELRKFIFFLWVGIGIGYAALAIRLAAEPRLGPLPGYLLSFIVSFGALASLFWWNANGPRLLAIKDVLTGCSLVIAPFAIALLIAGWALTPPRFPKNVSLRNGMSQQDVRKLLGEPWDVYRNRTDSKGRKGAEEWIYSDGFSDPFVFEFDADGRLER